jgi:hypothetical protein
VCTGERLGFVLQQKYSAGLSDLAALSFPEALKGPDRLLAAALEQTGLRMRWECSTVLHMWQMCPLLFKLAMHHAACLLSLIMMLSACNQN